MSFDFSAMLRKQWADGKRKPTRLKGYKHTVEARQKMSLAAMGKKGNPGSGRKPGFVTTEEVKRKLSAALKGRPNTKNRGRFVGEKSVNWQGDKISYRSLHKWIQGKRGEPHYCEHCKRSDLRHRQYHWANISGEYKRDLNDYIRLCVSCHKKYDLSK